MIWFISGMGILINIILWGFVICLAISLLGGIIECIFDTIDEKIHMRKDDDD